jgi:hypothetical protein
LHYEILSNNRRVNPMRLKMPSGRTLKGNELRRFQSVRAAVDRQYAGGQSDEKLALLQ